MIMEDNNRMCVFENDNFTFSICVISNVLFMKSYFIASMVLNVERAPRFPDSEMGIVFVPFIKYGVVHTEHR